MKIYLDVVFFINIMFDFLLLLTTSIVLKRNSSFFRIVLGAFVGGISIFLLFLPLSSFSLFLFKVVVSILMILTSFGWKSKTYFRENICYFYLISIILGGFLYFLNIQFSYKNIGLVFFFHEYSVPVIFLLIVSPIILFLYYKSVKSLRNIRENYHTVEIYLDHEVLSFSSYLDTGNHLYDPYFHKPILLVYSEHFKIPDEKAILVPYEVVGYQGMLKCQKVKKIRIDKKIEIRGVLVAKSETPFQIDGVDAILHPDFLK